MGHRLTALRSAINDKAIPLVEPLPTGYFSGGKHEFAKECLVLSLSRRYRWDKFLWDNNDMSRCLRSDVTKREDPLILEDFSGGNLTPKDLSENRRIMWRCLHRIASLACSVKEEQTRKIIGNYLKVIKE